MPDNLRDRIAKAVSPHLVDMDAKAVADAVIRELKLSDGDDLTSDQAGQSASLRDRMIYAILDVLTDDDPAIMVEFSPNELRITIPSDPEPTVTI